MKHVLLICVLMVGCSADPTPVPIQAASGFHFTMSARDHLFQVSNFGPIDSEERMWEYFSEHPIYKKKLASIPPDLWYRMTGASSGLRKKKDKDWNVAQSGANSSYVEFYFGATAADDRIFAYVQSSGTDTITSYKDVTNTNPTQVWQYTIDAPLDHTWIQPNMADDHMLFVTHAGTVYSLCVSDGNCGTGTHKEWSTAIGHTVVHASPWSTSDETPEAVYVADESGYLTKLKVSDGSQLAQVRVSTTKALHMTPWEYGGTVWAGCDDGKLYRYSTGLSAHDMPTNLSASGTPGTFDAIWSDPSIDGNNDKVYINVNDKLQMVKMNASFSDCVETSMGGPCQTSSVTTVAGTNKINQSTPTLDEFGSINYIYSAFNGKIFRCAYTNSGGSPPSISLGTCTGIDVNASPTRTSGNFSLPKASPNDIGIAGGSGWGNNSILMGDGDGNVDRFTSTAGTWSRAASTNPNSCTSVEGYLDWGCFDAMCATDTFAWNCNTSGGSSLIYLNASGL